MKKIPERVLRWVPTRLVWALQLWLLGLLLCQLLRVLLYVLNPTEFAALGMADAFPVLLASLRFDAAVLALLQGPLLAIGLLPVRVLHPAGWPRLWAVLGTLAVLPVVVLNGADIAYFPFTHRRSTYELATMGGDVARLMGSFLLEFWWLLLLAAALLAAYGWAVWRLARRLRAEAKPVAVEWTGWVLVCGLLFLAFRGGLQQLPLRPADAFGRGHYMAGHLALNSVYTVYHSLVEPLPDDLKLMANAEALPLARAAVLGRGEEYLDARYPFWRKRTTHGKPRRLNVVVVILESYAAAYVGGLNGRPASRSLTPHLDSLSRHGLLFTHFYANGSRSPEVFPAILNGLPDMFARSIIGSEVETNYPHGLGHILAAEGYQTMMLHGGRNGSLGLDTYAQLSGLAHYVGKNEYEADNGSGDDNGAWGIHDGPFLRYAATRLQQLKSPYLAVLFSLSSHHPFVYQEGEYAAIDRRKDLKPFEKTVLYTDYSLGRFMAEMARQPGHDSTLYIFTADHSFNMPGDPVAPFPDNYRVPLALYAPAFIRPGTSHVPGMQANVPATVLQLLNLNASYAAMGASLLDSTAFHFAVNHYGNHFSFETEKWAWLTDFAGYEQISRYDGEKGWVAAKALPAALSRRFMAYLQMAYFCVRQNYIAPRP